MRVALTLAVASVLFATIMATMAFADSKANQVRIRYVTPENPELRPIYEDLKGRPSLEDFADQHSTPAQRAYSVLCMAYGADTKLFSEFVSEGYLPPERAEYCEEEYEQVQDAYDVLVVPHLDEYLAREIFDRTWLQDSNRQRPR